MSAKRPPLKPRQKLLWLEWAEKYMETDIELVIFTDETRATLDDSDGWRGGWVANCQKRHCRFRRQQGGGGVMIWAGIIGN